MVNIQKDGKSFIIENDDRNCLQYIDVWLKYRGKGKQIVMVCIKLKSSIRLGRRSSSKANDTRLKGDMEKQ